jgi:hypothetical protein
MKTLTGIKDVDRMILSDLEDDRDLLSMCSTNKYIFNLCDDRLFRNRLYQKYPGAAQYKPKDIDWKQYYFEVAYWVNKLLEDKDFQYTTGDPVMYYTLLTGYDSISSKLLKSVKLGYLDIVKFLVEQGVDTIDLNFALKNASSRGHLDIVKYLIENGANIHYRNDLPLRLASNRGRLDVVKYLIENGANIHASNNGALKMATRGGYKNVVNYLKEQMAK